MSADEKLKIAVVGVGKIARDQHLPAIEASPSFGLAATVNRSGKPCEVPNFTSVDALVQNPPPLDAASICTPPQGRHALARALIEAGLHVMLEKPPGATVREVEYIADLAKDRGVTLFASWHSRAAAAVEPARAWLAGKQVHAVRIAWKEDVRVWHPGQVWIFEPGGLGVFDPGINALSILTRILPGALVLDRADLHFPANRAAPIAAELAFTYQAKAPVEAVFNFLQTGPQSWNIEAETDAGLLTLSEGASKMAVDGKPVEMPAGHEYPTLYARFAELIANKASDVDLSPLQMVADAFLLGRRIETDPFEY